MTSRVLLVSTVEQGGRPGPRTTFSTIPRSTPVVICYVTLWPASLHRRSDRDSEATGDGLAAAIGRPTRVARSNDAASQIVMGGSEKLAQGGQHKPCRRLMTHDL